MNALIFEDVVFEVDEMVKKALSGMEDCVRLKSLIPMATNMLEVKWRLQRLDGILLKMVGYNVT